MKELIPNINDSNWIIRKNKIFYKRKEMELVLEKKDYIYVYLNVKIVKKIVSLVKHLVEMKLDFYFLPTEDPYMDETVEECIIRHYLYSIVYKDFYYGFKKINFLLEDNLVEWAVKNNCFGLIKPVYEDLKKNINYYYYDYYTKNNIYTYNEELRHYYNELMRNMQIKLMLT